MNGIRGIRYAVWGREIGKKIAMPFIWKIKGLACSKSSLNDDIGKRRRSFLKGLARLMQNSYLELSHHSAPDH